MLGDVISIFSICLWSMKDNGVALSYLLWFLDPKTEPGTNVWSRKYFLNIAGPDSHSRVSVKLLREGQPALTVFLPPQPRHFLIALRTVCSGLFLHRPVRAKILGRPNCVRAVPRFVTEVQQNRFRDSSVSLELTESCFASHCIRSWCLEEY